MTDQHSQLTDSTIVDLLAECLRGEPRAQRALWFDKDTEEWIIGRRTTGNEIARSTSLVPCLQEAANILDDHPLRRRKLLYDAGLIDREIAERQGVASDTIASWRQRRNLPPNGPVSEKFWERRLTRLQELIEKGLSRSEISETLDVSPSTVSRWANRLDADQPIRREHTERMDRRRRLYEQGLSDADIAQRQGVKEQTIYAWRKKNNLPSNEDTSPSDQAKRLAERRQLYDKGLTDSEIAKRQGVSSSSVKSWRNRRGLPPNDWNGSDD